MPVALLGAGYLAVKRGPAGLVATAVMGLVGLGFIGGTTFNLPNDLDAARAAGSSEWAWYLAAAIHLPLGVASRVSPFLHSSSVACARLHFAINELGVACGRGHTAPSSSRQTPLGTPSPRSAHPASSR